MPPYYNRPHHIREHQRPLSSFSVSFLTISRLPASNSLSKDSTAISTFLFRVSIYIFGSPCSCEFDGTSFVLPPRYPSPYSLPRPSRIYEYGLDRLTSLYC